MPKSSPFQIAGRFQAAMIAEAANSAVCRQCRSRCSAASGRRAGVVDRRLNRFEDLPGDWVMSYPYFGSEAPPEGLGCPRRKLDVLRSDKVSDCLGHR